jgi:hypothetical protein
MDTDNKKNGTVEPDFLTFYQSLKTPTEIVKMFPGCGLTVEDIGRLIRMGFKFGIPLQRKAGGCLVSVQIFVKFLELRESLNGELENEVNKTV